MDFDEGDFIRGEVEEGVDLLVEGGFVGDDLLGEVMMLLAGVGQERFPVVPLFEGDVPLEYLFDFGAEGGEIEFPPGCEGVVERLLATTYRHYVNHQRTGNEVNGHGFI